MRDSPHGVFLSPDASGGEGAITLLLPNNEVDPTRRSGASGAREPRPAPGAEVDVFVYLDSDDRPIATRNPPRVALGEVAFLKVVDVNDVPPAPKPVSPAMPPFACRLTMALHRARRLH